MRTVTGIALAGLIVVLAALPGCNTVRGLGKDLKYGGEKIYQGGRVLGRGVVRGGKLLIPGKDKNGQAETSPSAQ